MLSIYVLEWIYVYLKKKNRVKEKCFILSLIVVLIPLVLLFYEIGPFILKFDNFNLHQIFDLKYTNMTCLNDFSYYFIDIIIFSSSHHFKTVRY